MRREIGEESADKQTAEIKIRNLRASFASVRAKQYEAGSVFYINTYLNPECVNERYYLLCVRNVISDLKILC